MRRGVYISKVAAVLPPECPPVEALVSAGDVLSIERRGERRRALVESVVFGQYTGWRYSLRYLDTNVFEIVTQAELRRRLTLTPEQVAKVQRAIALYMPIGSRTAA